MTEIIQIGLSYDLRPNILKVQILIGLMVGNVGPWSAKTFVWRRETQNLGNGGFSIAKLITIKILLHQFSNLMFNLHQMCLFS